MQSVECPSDAGPARPPPRNRLLAALPPSDLERLLPWLDLVPLKQGQDLQDSRLPLEHAFFLELGVASLQASSAQDGVIEVGLVNRIGMIGIPIVLGTLHSPFRSVVQIPGEALLITAAHLSKAMARSRALRRILLSYVQASMVQTSQLVLCNARHRLERRVARWLLLAHDRREGDEIRITHDLLSRILGVRRASVTEALAQIEDQGAILGDRGFITIHDRPRLERLTCNCYGIIRAEHDRMLQPHRQMT